MKHDQRPDSRDMTCFNCKNGACEVCVDVLRKKVYQTRICTCGRREHKQKVEAA